MFLIVAALLSVAPADPAADPAPPKEKKICRDDDTTGSRLTAKKCHTKSEWNEINAMHARDVERLRKDDRS